jgi:hypothetical protein
MKSEEMIMKNNRAVRVVGLLVFAIVFIAGFGSAVWQLWNLLMPKIFGLPVIGFWQAVGLLSLSWLFFGGFRFPMGGSRHRGFGPGMRGRWSGMTPEQRAKFREGLRASCGYQEPSQEAPKP